MTDEVWQRNEIASPCTKVCVIHRESGFCTGCFRTLDEIAAWGSYSDDQRAQLMDTLPDRKPLLSKRRGGRTGRLSRRETRGGPAA